MELGTGGCLCPNKAKIIVLSSVFLFDGCGITKTKKKTAFCLNLVDLLIHFLKQFSEQKNSETLFL